MIKFVSIGTAAFFLACLSAFGQTGARRDGYVFNQQGGTVAGATVRVCSTGWIGQPCTPLASLFSDIALTQPLSNPITTDQNGHYFYYVATATYEEEISGMGLPVEQTPDITITEPATGGGGGGGIPTLQCYDPGGSLILNWDAQLGTQCISANRLNAVIQTPSLVNGPNVVTPGDLSTPAITFQAIAGQTQPFFIFNNSSGVQVGYIDVNANIGMNTFTVLNTNGLSDFQQSTAPSGSAVAGFDFTYVDSITKRWTTKDDSGNVVSYIALNTGGTLSGFNFDTANSNTLKIGGTPLTSLQGGTSKVQTSNTFTQPSGSLVCHDSGGDLQDSGCTGTVTAKRCIADQHCTLIESGPTALSFFGDTATQAGTFSGGTIDANHGANVTAQTTTTPNTNVDVSGGALYRTGRNIDFVFNGSFTDGSGGVTNVRVMLCVTDQAAATQMNSSTPAGNWACFRFDTGAADTVWRAITSDAGTATNTSTATTPDVNQHQYEIQFTDATPNVVFAIDGTVVATNTTNLPAASTNLRYVVGVQNLSTNNATFQVSSAYVKSDK